MSPFIEVKSSCQDGLDDHICVFLTHPLADPVLLRLYNVISYVHEVPF